MTKMWKNKYKIENVISILHDNRIWGQLRKVETSSLKKKKKIGEIQIILLDLAKFVMYPENTGQTRGRWCYLLQTAGNCRVTE